MKHPLQFRNLVRAMKKHGLRPTKALFVGDDCACAVGAGLVNIFGDHATAKSVVDSPTHGGVWTDFRTKIADRAGVDVEKFRAIEHGFLGNVRTQTERKYRRYYNIGRKFSVHFYGR